METIEKTQHQFSYTDSSNGCQGVIKVLQIENDYTMISITPNKDIDAKPKSTEKQSSEKAGSAKRQRKPKAASEAKAERIKNVENKPKRSRTTKSKTNPIKIEPAPAILPSDDAGAAGKCNLPIEFFLCCEKINTNYLILFIIFSFRRLSRNIEPG